MSAAVPVVELRAAQASDHAFLARVYASTREEELAAVPWAPDQKAAFLAHQFHAQTVHYARHYADSSFDVVVVDGAPAGRLIVWRGLETIRIVDIALLPEFRRRGIGGGLLGDLIAESDAAGSALEIHVERNNPARSLYERLGFEVAPGGDDVYLLMRRPPG